MGVCSDMDKGGWPLPPSEISLLVANNFSLPQCMQGMEGLKAASRKQDSLQRLNAPFPSMSYTVRLSRSTKPLFIMKKL